MRPILLQGHSRAITQIKYNPEGDLLFSVAKDSKPNVWYSLNGERLGTYNGHNGAVWCIDVNYDSTKVLSGSADNSCRLWDTETGKQLAVLETRSAVRACEFSFSGKQIMLTTDKALKQLSSIQVFDIRDHNQLLSGIPMMQVTVPDSKITSAVWGPLDEFIITGHDNGDICQYDPQSGDLLHRVQAHAKSVNNIQLSQDKIMLISASKDTTSKLFDAWSLDVKKSFRTDRPVNSAALSPTAQHVIIGGGQEAMDVTTTSGRMGKFDAYFFHLVFEEEFARVRDHFGPITTVSYHPDGKSYSSGGEDGYVRVHYFDTDYFNYQLEC